MKRGSASERGVRICLAAAILLVAGTATPPAEAASVYADWATVETIEYNAGSNTYRVLFSGTPGSTETDANGNLCDIFSWAVVKASSAGVTTTDEEVDRMIDQLYIAYATGNPVTVRVHQCDNYNNASTYPKVYIVVLRK